jgi:hypothetical protein
MVYAAGHDVVGSTADGLEHGGFGTVQGEDGKLDSRRVPATPSGWSTRTTVNRMEEQVKGRIGEQHLRWTVHLEGYQAVSCCPSSYYDLRRNRHNYKFTYDELDTKRTRPYFWHAHYA